MSEEIEYPSKERERAKVNVKVSAEVNTYLHDLYNQIQYEFCEQYEDEIKHLQQKVEQLEEENDKLKHKLNDIAFGDDSELALRFLRKIDYVDFDEKRKVYINKHNNEPFIWEDEQEKDYYLKDEELNEYTQQLEYKLEQLENIIKEAIEYINNEIFKRTILVGVGTKKYTRNILDNILNILNKGE